MSAESYRESIGNLTATDRGILALDDMSHHESAQLLHKLGDHFGMAKENANAQVVVEQIEGAL